MRILMPATPRRSTRFVEKPKSCLLHIFRRAYGRMTLLCRKPVVESGSWRDRTPKTRVVIDWSIGNGGFLASFVSLESLVLVGRFLC